MFLSLRSIWNIKYQVSGGTIAFYAGTIINYIFQALLLKANKHGNP